MAKFTTDCVFVYTDKNNTNLPVCCTDKSFSIHLYKNHYTYKKIVVLLFKQRECQSLPLIEFMSMQTKTA